MEINPGAPAIPDPALGGTRILQMHAASALLFSDLHGHFAIVQQAVQHAAVSHSVLLALGDIGLGFHDPRQEAAELGALDSWLGERHCTLLAIRGNHDDPGYWRAPPYALEHIRLVPDYTVVALHLPALPRCHILMVGGAISVDRRYRLQRGTGYWPDEGFRYDPAAIAALAAPIDMVISHSAPDFVYPTGSSRVLDQWAAQDPHLRSDLVAERRAVAAVYTDLQARNHPLHAWHYGHFHPEQSVVTVVNQTQFIAHPMERAVRLPWPVLHDPYDEVVWPAPDDGDAFGGWDGLQRLV